MIKMTNKCKYQSTFFHWISPYTTCRAPGSHLLLLPFLLCPPSFCFLTCKMKTTQACYETPSRVFWEGKRIHRHWKGKGGGAEMTSHQQSERKSQCSMVFTSAYMCQTLNPCTSIRKIPLSSFYNWETKAQRRIFP